MPTTFPNESPAYRSARDALLEAEIALRAQVEEVARQRRALPPGGTLPQDYAFTALDGEQRRISSLFGEHDTLALYSYMFAPEAKAPCPACTSLMDGWNGHYAQLNQRIALAAVSSAPPAQLAPLVQSRGWVIPVYSAQGTDYQTQYHGVDEKGVERTFMNIFVRDGGTIRHSWGSELERADVEGHPRHLDQCWPLWGLLDLTPQGRGDFFPDIPFNDGSSQ